MTRDRPMCPAGTYLERRYHGFLRTAHLPQMMVSYLPLSLRPLYALYTAPTTMAATPLVLPATPEYATFMVDIQFSLPEEALASLRQDPNGFSCEMRVAAAVKWYELELISQQRAAEIAGLSRSEFIAALQRFGVSPFQYSAEEIIAESLQA